jgi:tRNA A-37 threonylcarbamoyl transferase component Bud32
MADLQVPIEYKNQETKHLLTVMTVMFPLWAIIAPAMLGATLANIISHTSQESSALTIVGLVIFTLSAIAVTAFSEDKHIHISKDGIAFPILFLSRLKLRRFRSWAELTDLDLLGSLNGNSAQRLTLGFNSGEVVPLDVSCVKSQDLEQLFLAIELWATNCKRSSTVLTMKQELQNTGHGGHTQMWDDELSRRYRNTVFIPLEPGHILQDGRIKIIRQLAFGGLSAIYLAQINNLDLVVVKEAVTPNQTDETKQKQAEEYLDREARLLKKISHANIARVLDHFVEEKRHYLILEHVNGQDLRQFVQQTGTVQPQVAVEWAITICSMLKFLHGQDPPIIHRDLTPDNLIRTNQGEIILIDFGAANQFLGAATGTIIGKQAYIPPEQLRGKTVLQSDIYALGCTIHYLLTGRDPTPLSLSHLAVINTEADAKLDAIIAKCTAFECKERYQTAAEVETALLEVVPLSEAAITT